MKGKWLSFPFICFHLFFGIGAFQWVTLDSNTLFLTLRLWAPMRSCSDGRGIRLMGMVVLRSFI
jgi:hypothetical protein